MGDGRLMAWTIAWTDRRNAVLNHASISTPPSPVLQDPDRGILLPGSRRLRGPSDAAIWSTPTVDVERGRIYVTSGENTSLPATGTQLS